MDDTTLDPITYRVDRHDVIVGIGGPWREFAVANGVPDLPMPIGEDLYASIAGGATRIVTQRLLERVRASRRVVEIPFRCDAPQRRRHMRLRLEPGDDGSIGFRSWVERTEDRDDVSLLDAQAARSGELLKICSWCKKVDVEGEWVEVEDALLRLGLFEAPLVPDITHGICDPCEQALLTAV